MTRGPRTTFTSTAAGIGLAALLALPASAGSGKPSADGWAHRSSTSTNSVGADGWASRSPEKVVTDGFQVSQVRLPQATGIAHGFEVSQVELPQQEPVTDGFEASLVALPKPMAIDDGWAVRSELTRRPAPAIDGWSYAALASAPEAVTAAPAPAPKRQPATPPYELIVMALAVAVLAGGMTMLASRRHHHIPA